MKVIDKDQSIYKSYVKENDMGMSISAKMMYGLWYEDLVLALDDDALELFTEELYDEVWDTASPWYDSDLQDQFIGFRLSRNFSLDSLQKFKEEIENAEAAFFARFGVKGYVQAVPNIY